MQLICEYALVFPLKDKRGITIINAFQNILDSSSRKPNKTWIDQGGEFCNYIFKKFLKNNKIEMYSTYNEGKSVGAERSIRTLKSKIFRDMTAISKNVYYDVLDDIVNKYNNRFHRTIKMKPIEVTSNSYAEWNENSNEKDSKFKAGDRVRISKYKNIFAKGYTQDWSEEVFIISKIKNIVPWTYAVSALNGEEINVNFYKKELQKTNQQKFRI